jgi:hypothetical protein
MNTSCVREGVVDGAGAGTASLPKLRALRRGASASLAASFVSRLCVLPAVRDSEFAVVPSPVKMPLSVAASAKPGCRNAC